MIANKLKIGFIGCGRAAQTVHLPYFADSEKCELTTLVDERLELATVLAERHGIPKVSSDYRDLCDDPEIDGVVMILRESLHAPVAIDLLNSGKHVFTEKPLSDRLHEADRLTSVAKKTGKILMVGYMRRYDPGIIKAKEIVRDFRQTGQLGAITQVRIQPHSGGTGSFAYGSSEPVTTGEPKPSTPKGPSDEIPEEIRELSWTSNFFDTHLGDMLLYILDPVKSVLYAEIDRDTKSRIFVYDHGEYRTVHTGGSFGMGPRDESFTVYFDLGRVTIWPSNNFLRDVHANLEIVRGNKTNATVERPVIDGEWAFKAQAEHFLKCIIDDQTPLCNANDGLKEVERTHAVLRKLSGID